MSVYVDDEQQIIYEQIEEEIHSKKDSRLHNPNKEGGGGGGGGVGEPPTATMEAEKRIRREIANSNERRRMQSINNGFQSLRSLLPHHEGEKLSKAAILQQTAEYIYSLEQEKTRLLSQNCQLKRLVSQHESGVVNTTTSTNNSGELPPKKRKTEIIISSVEAASDERLGSMSPEPVGLIVVNAVNNNNNTNGINTPCNGTETNSLIELRRQLERERNLRAILEEQVRQFENQLYLQQQNTSSGTTNGGTTTTTTSLATTTQIYQVSDGTEEISLQLVAADNLPPVGHTQTVVCTPQHSRSPSPEPLQEQRLPSVLEAAIKAEPKVEVERLPSPNPGCDESAATTTVVAAAATTTATAPTRLYVSNTSRQNLETIVEAIRHLEGDHMFAEEPTTTATTVAANTIQQQVPLALTKNQQPRNTTSKLMEFSAAMVQQSQQSRPGVIVVKQAS